MNGRSAKGNRIGGFVAHGVRAAIARRQGCVPGVERQPVVCEYCGAEGWLTWKVAPAQTVGNVHSSLEWDHVVPHSRGGGNHLENVALACVTCNRKKWNRDLDEFKGRQ